MFYNMINDMDAYFSIRESRERRSHYPSDALSCMRQLFWKWRNEPVSDEMADASWYKFKMGDKTEDIVEEFLVHSVEHGKIDEFEKQIKFEVLKNGLKHPISGRIDFKFRMGDKWYGLEVKSSYGNGMRQLIAERMPKDTAIIQTFIYMKEMKMDFLNLWFARDNGYRTQFWLQEHDEGILVDGDKLYKADYDQIINRFIDLEKHLDSDTLPDRDFVVAIKNGEIKDKFQKDKVVYKTDWQCSYCDWKTKCWTEVVDLYKDGENSEMFKGGK